MENRIELERRGKDKKLVRNTNLDYYIVNNYRLVASSCRK